MKVSSKKKTGYFGNAQHNHSCSERYGTVGGYSACRRVGKCFRLYYYGIVHR